MGQTGDPPRGPVTPHLYLQSRVQPRTVSPLYQLYASKCRGQRTDIILLPAKTECSADFIARIRSVSSPHDLMQSPSLWTPPVRPPFCGLERSFASGRSTARQGLLLPSFKEGQARAPCLEKSLVVTFRCTDCMEETGVLARRLPRPRTFSFQKALCADNRDQSTA